mmetsp:Transcript_87229/g.244179  ORF Transcript_87229/g.244179 Transcript_87229/m.244179 type:complete len:204 (+) Transcript_87229:221-832(+)
MCFPRRRTRPQRSGRTGTSRVCCAPGRRRCSATRARRAAQSPLLRRRARVLELLRAGGGGGRRHRGGDDGAHRRQRGAGAGGAAGVRGAAGDGQRLPRDAADAGGLGPRQLQRLEGRRRCRRRPGLRHRSGRHNRSRGFRGVLRGGAGRGSGGGGLSQELVRRAGAHQNLLHVPLAHAAVGEHLRVAAHELVVDAVRKLDVHL